MIINLLCIKRRILATLLASLPIITYGITGKLYEYGKMTNSLVTQLCQDKYGYIWIASDFGLNKFDGYHFRGYYHISRDTTSIPHNLIRSLLCSKDGSMYVGTGKGFARYDYNTDKFHIYNFPSGVLPRVNSLTELPSGNILVCTAGYGIYILDKRSDKLRKEESFSKLSGNEYLAKFYIENENTTWCHTNDNRLVCFKIKNDRAINIKTYKLDDTPVNILNTVDRQPLFVMKTCIMRYDSRTDKIVDAGYELPKDIFITSACLRSNGNIIATSSRTGIYEIKNGEKKAYKLDIYNGHYPMTGLTINSVMEDRGNNIWLTIPHHGIYLGNMSQHQFLSLNFTVDGRLHNEGFLAITKEGGAKGFYCVPSYKGLYHVDLNGNIKKCLGAPADCSTVMCDSQGRCWVGTWKSLYLYDPVHDRSEIFDDLSNKGTPYISEDKIGNIYVSVFGEGFAVYDGKNKKLRYYNSRTTAKDKVVFENDWVGQMFCDHLGMMWITSSYGTWCFNPKTHKFIDLEDGKGILMGKSSVAIGEMKNHNIVVGTESGVYVYNRLKRKTTILPGTEAIEDMKVSGLVVDAKGDIWISTVKGLWQYDSNARKLISHLGNSEIMDNEFCHGVFCHLDNDTVVFGTNTNIMAFYPNAIRKSRKVEGKIYLTRFSTTEKVENPFADKFVIPWDDNHFTMEFSMLNYQNEAMANFEYSINGGKWIAFENNGNSLTFTKLKSGTYDIRVRATINGWYSDDIKQLTVVVESPWYSSWMAIFVYIILASTFIIYIVIGARRRQRARFEEEKVKLLINATHDIRSPLTLILGPLENMKSLIGKMTNNDSVKEMNSYLNVIERNAERLLLLVNQILDLRKIDKQQMKLKCKETDIIGLVEKSCKMFEYNARQKGYKFTFDHPTNDTLMVWIDRLHFEQVVSNLLSNAFKYTPEGGQVKVEIVNDDKFAILKVTDSGIGISENNPTKLFDRFYQGDANDSTGIPGTGIGLNLARSVVEMNGGTITAANRTDGIKGACFTVKIPLGNTHLKPENIYHPKIEDQPAKKTIYHKCKIMIVDDDEELAAYTARELRQWYHIDVFNDGDSAFTALIDGDYDLVVSDVIMPGTDGISLLKKIKTNPMSSHIPVILLTSKSEVEDRLLGFRSGADAYISKPFSCEMLHARIDNLVDNMRRMRGKFSGAQLQQDKVEKIEVKGYDDEMMVKVMKSINEHISDPDYSVDNLANDVGMSRVQLHRKIKEVTGMSTGKLIRNIRMEEAGRLIKDGRINVAHVAYEVGFNDPTYFSTVFKKYYGVTPTEYGKKGK